MADQKENKLSLGPALNNIIPPSVGNKHAESIIGGKSSSAKAGSQTVDSIQIADEELKTDCVMCLRRVYVTVPGLFALTVGWVILLGTGNYYELKLAAIIIGSFGALTVLVSTIVIWCLELHKTERQKSRRIIENHETMHLDGATIVNINNVCQTEDVYYNQRPFRPRAAMACKCLFIMQIVSDLGMAYLLCCHKHEKIREESSSGGDATLLRGFSGSTKWIKNKHKEREDPIKL